MEHSPAPTIIIESPDIVAIEVSELVKVIFVFELDLTFANKMVS